jgi:hypothetical protein
LGWVLGDTGRFPLDCQVKQVPQQNKQAIARSRSMGLTVLGKQCDQVSFRNLIGNCLSLF